MPESCFSVAGKVFILGEYAVLAGRPALVAAVEPRFRLSRGEPHGRAGGWEPSSASPAGRLLEFIRRRVGADRTANLRFVDPHEGCGGFGASTAQFALLYRVFAEEMGFEPRWRRVWALYRELTDQGRAIPPSGADLVAQWQGGIVFFDPSERLCFDVSPLLDWTRLLVFSAAGKPGRKVATHEHLERLSGKELARDGAWVSALSGALEAGIRAVHEGDGEKLGLAMNAYAETLSGLGLENAEAREDRLALRALPGVIGAKGAGALLSDAVIVLLNERGSRAGGPGVDRAGSDERGSRAQVVRAAEARGLRLVGDGIGPQAGVLCAP